MVLPLLEYNLTVSYKTRPTLSIQSSNLTSCYLTKGVENYVHTAFTQIFIAALFTLPKVEATKVSFSV